MKRKPMSYLKIVCVTLAWLAAWMLIPYVFRYSIGNLIYGSGSHEGLLLDIFIGTLVVLAVFFTHRNMNRLFFKKHWSMYLLIPVAILVIIAPIRAGGLDQSIYALPAWLYICMSLINVVMQEYFTFGILQSYIQKYFSPLATIIATGLLFYVAHAVFIPHRYAPVYILPSLFIIIIGIIGAALRQKTGVIYISLALHLAVFLTL